MLPISSSRMKSCCIGKESRNDAPQNRIWITYTKQPTEWWMRPSPLYTLCAHACTARPHPRLLRTTWQPAMAAEGNMLNCAVPLTWDPNPPGPQMPRPRLGTRTSESTPLAGQWPQELLSRRAACGNDALLTRHKLGHSHYIISVVISYSV